MRAGARQIAFWGACLIGAASGCECDDRIRSWVSDRPETGGDAGLVPVSMSSSQPRESEPNGTPAEATPIVLGAELRPVLGELDDASDLDWFVLSGAPETIFEITASPRAPGLDLAILVGSADQRYDAVGWEGAERAPLVRGEGVAIGVASSSGRGAYALEFKRRMSAGALEVEPNDDPSRAIRLSLPSEVEGFLDRPHDVDRFELVSQSAAPFDVTLRAWPGAAPRLEIEGARAFMGPAGGVAQIPNVLVAPGAPVRLAVSASASSAERAYSLRVIPRNKKVESGQVLELEPNDEPEGANLVDARMGELLVLGSLHHDADLDRFRLPAPPEPGARLAARVESADPSLAVALRIGEPEPGSGGAEACGIVPGGSSGGDLSASIGAAPGSEGARFPASYRFSARWMMPPEGARWEVEPNEERAERLEAGALLVGLMEGASDIDRFALSVESGPGPGGLRSVSLELGPHPGALALELLDGAGLPIARGAPSPAGGSSIEVELPPGPYIARVSAPGPVPCQAYSLRWSAR